jgi:Tol biopolymer transport system component
VLSRDARARAALSHLSAEPQRPRGCTAAVSRRLLVLACLTSTLAAACGSGGPHAAPTGGLILFWSDSPYPSLRSVWPDGSHLRRVYKTRQNAKRPSLSPDRRRIAFDGTPPGLPVMSDFRVQVVRRDGSGRRTLTKPPLWSLDAEWSPDGKLLAFTRMSAHGDGSDASVWVAEPDGDGLRRVADGQSARWSPDGKRLALSDRGGDVVVVNADGSDAVRLTASRALEQPAAWSPDGRRILLTRWPPGSSNSDVYAMDANGRHVRRLTRSGSEDIAATWSPDGLRILFTSTRTGLSQLFLMRPDGSHQRRLLRSGINALEPSWR